MVSVESQMGIGCFAEFAYWPGAITRGRHDGSSDDLIHQADVNAWSPRSAPGVSRILITTSPTPQPLSHFGKSIEQGKTELVNKLVQVAACRE